jgi:hypothetical protein
MEVIMVKNRKKFFICSLTFLMISLLCTLKVSAEGFETLEQVRENFRINAACYQRIPDAGVAEVDADILKSKGITLDGNKEEILAIEQKEFTQKYLDLFENHHIGNCRVASTHYRKAFEDLKRRSVIEECFEIVSWLHETGEECFFASHSAVLYKLRGEWFVSDIMFVNESKSNVDDCFQIPIEDYVSGKALDHTYSICGMAVFGENNRARSDYLDVRPIGEVIPEMHKFDECFLFDLSTTYLGNCNGFISQRSPLYQIKARFIEKIKNIQNGNGDLASYQGEGNLSEIKTMCLQLWQNEARSIAFDNPLINTVLLADEMDKIHVENHILLVQGEDPDDRRIVNLYKYGGVWFVADFFNALNFSELTVDSFDLTIASYRTSQPREILVFDKSADSLNQGCTHLKDLSEISLALKEELLAS